VIASIAKLIAEKCSIVECCKVAAWMEILGSVAEVCRRFEEEFEKDPPSRPTIYAIH